MKAYLILFLLALCCGCERPKSAGEHNVIKEYVNTPKEKATDVKDKLEAVQSSAAENAKEILDDEEDEADTGDIAAED